MKILVQVSVLGNDGKVLEQVVELYDGSYGYEVEQMFDKLGDQYRDRIDEQYTAR